MQVDNIVITLYCIPCPKPQDNMVSRQSPIRSRCATLLLALLVSMLAATTTAFTIVPAAGVKAKSRLFSEPWGGASKSGSSSGGNMEQVEYKIFPDGRVEETVRGVKGNNCHKVTDKVNEQLGEVVASSPTEEMYEQELVNDQTLTQNDGDSFEGGTSW